MSLELLKTKNGLLTILLACIVSCVGTVQNKNLPVSNVADSAHKTTPISFDGLVKVQGVSDSKIEVFFYEAVTVADEVIYEVYVNNSAIPIKLSSKSTPKVSGGMLLYTMSGLDVNTVYSFNMRAVPAGETSTTKLDASKTLYTSTLNNETAKFSGIASATTLPGVDGLTKILVTWLPAYDSGLDAGTDPAKYEITYISEDGGLDKINTVGAATRATVQVSGALSEYTITGLTSGKKYYFQVRAIHNAFVALSPTTPSYRREVNTVNATATTLIATDTLKFPSPQIAINNPVGKEGLTSLDVNWQAASGNFNNYYV